MISLPVACSVDESSGGLWTFCYPCCCRWCDWPGFVTLMSRIHIFKPWRSFRPTLVYTRTTIARSNREWCGISECPLLICSRVFVYYRPILNSPNITTGDGNIYPLAIVPFKDGSDPTAAPVCESTFICLFHTSWVRTIAQPDPTGDCCNHQHPVSSQLQPLSWWLWCSTCRWSW